MTVDEWDYRALCPDGGCTGLIGPTGQCNVCDRAAQNWGDERKRGMRNPTDPLPVVAATDEPNELAPSAPAKMGAVLSAWSSRELCSDGGCIGVVGADGKCNVCGKTGAPLIAKGTAEHEDHEDSSEDDADETGADADEAQAEDDEDDEGDDGDDDDDDTDDDDDESDDDDEDEEPDDEENNDSIHASSSDGESLETASSASLEAPPERQLCPDGACVGVLGSNGTCKVCGKAQDAETST
ncbi:hypothetical protein BH11MYX2_BH11MYX2_15480 [soil metagenome]